jgi:uncharacterized pyridoxamine 5'-phosphate oxidase family protein
MSYPLTKEAILQFINEHPVFFLATAEGEQPHVRGLMLFRADETGIYFSTAKTKSLYKQLNKNPLVEICFATPETQIRVNGRLEDLDHDLGLKKEILAARPFMQPWIDAAGFESMAVFRMVNCIAIPWSITNPIGRKRVIPI